MWVSEKEKSMCPEAGLPSCLSWEGCSWNQTWFLPGFHAQATSRPPVESDYVLKPELFRSQLLVWPTL